MKAETVKPKKVVTKTDLTIPGRVVDRTLAGSETNSTPEITDIQPPEEAAETTMLVREYLDLKNKAAEAEKRIGVIKQQLLEVIIGNGIPGDKGFMCPAGKVTYNEQSRMGLSEELLLRHIPADVLESCKVEGAKYHVLLVRPSRNST